MIRVGRRADSAVAERWCWDEGDLRRVSCAEQPWTAPFDAIILQQVLSAALEEVSRGPADQRSLHLLVESAWMPVLGLSLSPNELWTQRQLVALLEHRLHRVWSAAVDAPDGWSSRVEHRPGDGYALGFAWPRSVERTAIDAASAAGCRLTSITPSFAWGRARLLECERSARGSARSAQAWQLWVEMDRTLVALAAHGRVRWIHPAAPQLLEVADARMLIPRESVRAGAAAGPGIVGGLGELGAGSRLTLSSIDRLPAEAADVSAPTHA